MIVMKGFILLVLTFIVPYCQSVLPSESRPRVVPTRGPLEENPDYPHVWIDSKDPRGQTDELLRTRARNYWSTGRANKPYDASLMTFSHLVKDHLIVPHTSPSDLIIGIGNSPR